MEKLAGHIRLFTPKALKELLKKNGFKVIKIWGEDTGYTTEFMSSKIPTFLASLFKKLDNFFKRFYTLSAFFGIKAVK